MNKMMEKIIEKSGNQLCEVAKISAAISVNSCRGIFYQPGEPDGVRKMAEKRGAADKAKCK